VDFYSSVAPGLVIVFALFISLLCFRRIRSLSAKPYAKWRRICEYIAFSATIVVFLTAGASTAFNALAIHHYRAMYPPQGRLYTVDGYKMHLYCTGEGSPTIVLDAGLGNDSLIWADVQPTLSKTTRVCSYDRAGFGWSDLQPRPRDAHRITDQLHTLLTEAGIKGPIVLMGHSIAGLYIRDYAARYPQNLSGVIFVDGSTPLQEDRFPGRTKLVLLKAKLELLQTKWLYVLGIPRITGDCNIGEGFEILAGKMLSEDQCRAALFTALEREDEDFRQSGKETIHTGPFGDLPILIFSQDNHPSATEPRSKVDEIWDQMQEELKSLSTRSRRIIAKGSGHYIQVDRPDLLNSRVADLIRQIRGEASPSNDYGTTKTEWSNSSVPVVTSR
jgi:pimeloyl-ACP methyl ester carboxylesterase